MGENNMHFFLKKIGSQSEKFKMLLGVTSNMLQAEPTSKVPKTVPLASKHHADNPDVRTTLIWWYRKKKKTEGMDKMGPVKEWLEVKPIQKYI